MTVHPAGHSPVDLGPERLRLANMMGTGLGGVTTVLMGVVGAMGLVLVGLGIVTAGESLPLAMVCWVLGAGVGALGIIGVQQCATTSVIVHDHGITLRQPWFVRRSIPWAEVVGMLPPGREIHAQRFDLALRNGTRQLVTRLSIAPRFSPSHGRLVQHRDVEAVLGLYAQWRSGHGA